MKFAKRLCFATSAALAAGAVSADTYGKFETPRYSVEQVIGDVEIRNYAPHIVAEVRVRGDRSVALSSGFRVLAGYIFGGNSGKTGVAMTAPVGQVVEDGVWTVTFTMPSEWTLDTLPTPDSEAIRLREIEGYRQAALIFSGRGTDVAIAQAEQTLRTTMRDAGLSADGPLGIAFYDDPMTLPWNRRNEVALALTK